MKKFIIIIIVLALPFNFFAQEIVGAWYGMLEGANLRIVFHITENEGIYSATLDSPDQGAAGLPVGGVLFEYPKLKLNMPDLGAVYDGEIGDNGERIEGIFEQRGAKLKLVLTREKIEKKVINRPQEPKRPYPYYEEELTFENKTDNIKLAGTLTLPKKEGVFPAVILITGSGPQDRNEEIVSHKPFLVISDYLTRNRIAVLRFDDRGIGKSTGDFSKATSEDFATDVLSAIEYLKARKEINKSKIGLIGHSEGGLIAPMVAQKSKDVAFIVLLAGPGIPGDEIIYLQNSLIGKVEGQNDTTMMQMNELYKTAFNILKKENDMGKAKKEITKAITQKLKYYKDSLKTAELMPENQVGSYVATVTSPWFKYFISHDPALTLEKITCPVLSLIGEKDLQVPPKENQDAIKAALDKGKNKNYRIKTLEGLNHLFQKCETGSPMEYADIEETISPVALTTITEWIKEQTK